MERVIPFTVSATELAALAVTPKTLFSFPEDGLIRVITRVELKKDAGTAYTLTTTDAESNTPDGPARVFPFRDTVDSYTAGFGQGAFLQFEMRESNGAGRAFLIVPEAGFLDQTTEQTRLAFPVLDNLILRPRLYYLTLASTTVLASGTGSLNGRVYYEEYTLGGF